jgi:hypothetical protein
MKPISIADSFVQLHATLAAAPSASQTPEFMKLISIADSFVRSRSAAVRKQQRAVAVGERVLQDPDLVLHILQSLHAKELGLAAQVCTTWRCVTDCDSALWKAVCLRSPCYPLLDTMKETHPDICRRSYKALYAQRCELQSHTVIKSS